jgi:hypothetical protein
MSEVLLELPTDTASVSLPAGDLNMAASLTWLEGQAAGADISREAHRLLALAFGKDALRRIEGKLDRLLAGGLPHRSLWLVSSMPSRMLHLRRCSASRRQRGWTMVE